MRHHFTRHAAARRYASRRFASQRLGVLVLQSITRSRTIERQALADLLRLTIEGGTVSYSDMSKAVSVADIRAIRHIINMVRDELRDECGMVFEPIPTVGLRRMTSSDIATAVPIKRRKKSHRQAMLGLKELAAANPEMLPPGERLLHQSGSALLGAIAAISTDKAAKRITGSVASQGITLTVGDTLAALKEIK